MLTASNIVHHFFKTMPEAISISRFGYLERSTGNAF